MVSTATVGSTVVMPGEAVAFAEVVGVVPDGARVPMRPLESVPVVYVPFLIEDDDWRPGFSVFVRTSSPAERRGDLSRAIASIDPRMPWTRVETAGERFAAATIWSRQLATMVNVAAALALVLAAAGLFALLAYAVSLRAREMGIRLALGADAADLRRLVLRQALRLTVLGAVIGLAIVIPLATVMRAAIRGVSPFDPLALGPALGLLLLAALAAALLPARRAGGVDPVSVLRSE